MEVGPNAHVKDGLRGPVVHRDILGLLTRFRDPVIPYTLNPKP